MIPRYSFGASAKKAKKRAKWLFESLEDEGSQIVVPAVALSEYLTKVDRNQQKGVVASLGTRFIIAPFDVKCAALAAFLFSEGQGVVKKGQKGSRAMLRADSLIIATAVCHGVSIFYSGDKDCRKLAKRVPQLTVLDLPTVPLSLFD
ncbi:MAG: type II toxin-antitoxin system VapC family toxin [Phycisphaerae bacterium]|nr:type II toxin-antitoxin system VapC family toxin [Phycisphaerae bacterium]